MQAYRDKQGLIFSERDYCPDNRDLELINLGSESFLYHIEHEDLVVSVPGALSLVDLDRDLAEFSLESNIKAPQDYSISRIIAEDWGHNLAKQVLGLSLRHASGMESKTGGKVIKNVSGYDLAKIYIGSCNSLAVISGANLRLEKLPTRKAVIELTIGEDFKDQYYNQELINFLQKISSKDFDASCNVEIYFTRGLIGLPKFKLEFSGSAQQVQLRVQRALLRLETFFKVKLTDVDITLDEVFYQSSDKRLSLSLKQGDYNKSYPSAASRLEFHLALSDIYGFANSLVDLIDKMNNYSLPEDYRLIIYPKQSRIDLYINDSKLESWIDSFRKLRIRYLLSDYFVNIYPVTYRTRSLERKMNFNLENFEQKVLLELKRTYDPGNFLNPALLIEELVT